MVATWAWATAWAARPLPDYQDLLVSQAESAIDQLLEQGCAYEPSVAAWVCGDGVVQRVLARVDAFTNELFPHARLAYLAGLAHRYDGAPQQARQRLLAAIQLDPSLVEAWYDLGEVQLSLGAFDNAAECFSQVTRQLTSGPRAWLGPWRQAEVAAHKGDVDGFGTHVRVALSRGFSFQNVVGNAVWEDFYVDPDMGPVLDTLLLAYADSETRRLFQQKGRPSKEDRPSANERR